MTQRFDSARLEPMYATIAGAMPTGDGWTYEPKYDGMRVVAHVRGMRVTLVTRNGHDKAAQFPEVVAALRALGVRAKRPLVLDGEVVVLERGKAGNFQALQRRFHVRDAATIGKLSTEAPATLVLFDLLVDGTTPLLREPWSGRRRRLERLVTRPPEGLVLSESSTAGERMLARASAAGWEGVIAKRVDAEYVPGARSSDWRKLKVQHRAEFVVGGFTEPRRSREDLGALLLGYFDDDGALHYAGHTGGGFDRAGLRAMRARLTRLARARSPFAVTPKTNERAHWVTPRIVVEVKFAEWTGDGRLRQPIYLGVRDDKDARDVHRERESVQHLAGVVRTRVERRAAAGAKKATKRPGALPARKKTATRSSHPAKTKTRRRDPGLAVTGGVLTVGRGKTLDVSSLDKRFFPEDGVTKGDVMAYYSAVAPVLLPHLADRPLILKRYPNGIGGPSFFQQNAGESVPEGVRVAEVETEGGEVARRIIGGDLLTLLYTVQLGTIAVHPWQSRLPTIEFADYSTIDLDPGEGVPFRRVVELASHIGEELESLGLHAGLKTSGSRGLHIVLPLPARTPYERSATLAAAIADRIATRLPKLATTERRLQRRPKGTIYVDAQQNARGKSVASAYSLRERAGAPVSAPLAWRELTSSLDIADFNIETMPARIARIGDIWAEAMRRRNAARAIAGVVDA